MFDRGLLPGADRDGPGAPAWRSCTARTATSITFEGLSAHVGEGVPLDPAKLAAKLVEGGRGGYCFEQNLLFKAALEALGYEVEPHLARVRVGARAGPDPRAARTFCCAYGTASATGTPTSASAAAP